MDIANSPSCPCVCTDGVLGVHYQINETRRRVDGISELVLRGVLGCATSARKQASEQLATPAGAVRMTLSSLKPSRLFGLLVIFRIVNAVLCRTTFHADEYYQSLEIAHKLVFGYGWETWEWNPAVALRSPLHPLLFVPGYWILKVLGLDQTFLLVIVPKILQGFIAAVNDYYTAQLAYRLFETDAYTDAALFCSIVSFYNAEATIRTFSNSTETSLAAAALYYWPWARSTNSFLPSMLIAGVSCIIRPSSAVLWLFLASTAIPQGFDKVIRMIRATLLSLSFCVTLCVVVDTWFYGRPSFTPLNFLYFNVFQGIAAHYGVQPFYFYFIVLLPFLMMALLPFVILGTWLILRPASATPATEAVLMALATMLAFSGLSHKEPRFISPLLPIFHCVTAYGLTTASAASPNFVAYKCLPNVRKLFVQLILAVNLPVVLFCVLIHQRGTINLSHYVRNVAKGEIKSLGVAMPCHASPWQSYMHRAELELEDYASGYGGRIWGLTCEPPLNGTVQGYTHQTDVFLKDPCAFLERWFPATVDVSFPPSVGETQEAEQWSFSWPSHLALFESLLSRECSAGKDNVGDILRQKGYLEKARFAHTPFPTDSRQLGDVLLLAYSQIETQ